MWVTKDLVAYNILWKVLFSENWIIIITVARKGSLWFSVNSSSTFIIQFDAMSNFCPCFTWNICYYKTDNSDCDWWCASKRWTMYPNFNILFWRPLCQSVIFICIKLQFENNVQKLFYDFEIQDFVKWLDMLQYKLNFVGTQSNRIPYMGTLKGTGSLMLILLLLLPVWRDE